MINYIKIPGLYYILENGQMNVPADRYLWKLDHYSRKKILVRLAWPYCSISYILIYFYLGLVGLKICENNSQFDLLTSINQSVRHDTKTKRGIHWENSFNYWNKIFASIQAQSFDFRIKIFILRISIVKPWEIYMDI